jgi:hypothetical protein
MLFKGPKSLLDSITDVIKEERVQYAKEQAEMDKLVTEKMLSPKQKKIAAVAGDKSKIDAADFAALRSGKQVKEEAEKVEEATLSAKAARHGKDIGKPGKMFGNIAASAAKKYGSEEAGNRVAGAILKKMRNEGYNAKREHELNMDAAQRHMDRRAAEGEDMTGAKIHPKTYEIIMPKSTTKKTTKEEVEQVQEGDPSYYKGKSTTGNALPPPGSFADRKRTGNTFLKGFKSNPQPIKPYVAPKSKNEEVEQVGEAKEAKKPRKGSLRDQMAKQSKKYYDQQPVIEPRDQMVGVAKVKQGVVKDTPGNGRSVDEEVEQIDETLGATLRKYVPGLGKEELKKRYLDADTRTRYTLGKSPENHTDADKKELEMHAKKLRRYGKLVDKHIGEAYDDEQIHEISDAAKRNKRGEIANKVRQSLKNEATDTPGNGREHQCAIHVKNEQFGEGKTLTTQHAEPDENGDIAWYDVMFDHGIERVMTEDLDILVSEAHVHNKPKKGM